MKNRPILSFLVIAAALNAPCLAGGASHNTTILEIAIHRVHGNYVFIRTATPLTSSLACAVHGYWHFTLTLTNTGDRELYAMLLSAHAAGKVVSLTGLAVCNEYSAIESLNSINVL